MREGIEHNIVIPEHMKAARADKMMAMLYPELSRSRWQKLFQDGRVWQDERVLSQKTRLRAGDVVDISIPPVEPLDLRPVEMGLSIVFEDADLLVIDDNSPDGTGRWVDEQAASDPRIHCLHRAGKLGLGTATLAGMQYAIERGYADRVCLSHDAGDVVGLVGGDSAADAEAEAAQPLGEQVGDFTQIDPPVVEAGCLDRELGTQETVEFLDRLDERVVGRQPDRAAPVRVATEQVGIGFPGDILNHRAADAGDEA